MQIHFQEQIQQICTNRVFYHIFLPHWDFKKHFVFTALLLSAILRAASYSLIIILNAEQQRGPVRFNLQALDFVSFIQYTRGVASVVCFSCLHNLPLKAFSHPAEAAVVSVVNQAPVPRTNKQQAVQVESKRAMRIQATALTPPTPQIESKSTTMFPWKCFLSSFSVQALLEIKRIAIGSYSLRCDDNSDADGVGVSDDSLTSFIIVVC